MRSVHSWRANRSRRPFTKDDPAACGWRGDETVAVYVDDMMAPFRGMLMSHLTADTVEELQAFAARLGLKAEWFQDHRVPHYDVAKSTRGKAIKLGALAVQFGREPWRCDECFRPKLSCVKKRRCECPTVAI
jgi:hypothetical protein